MRFLLLKNLLFFSISLLYAQGVETNLNKEYLFSSPAITECKTPPSSPEEIRASRNIVDSWIAQNRDRPDEPVYIRVAFHVIHASNGTGNISIQSMKICLLRVTWFLMKI